MWQRDTLFITNSPSIPVISYLILGLPIKKHKNRTSIVIFVISKGEASDRARDRWDTTFNILEEGETRHKEHTAMNVVA